MVDVQNREQAILFLQHVLDYIAARYGGTLAHHLVSIAREQVIVEFYQETYHCYECGAEL